MFQKTVLLILSIGIGLQFMQCGNNSTNPASQSDNEENRILWVEDWEPANVGTYKLGDVIKGRAGSWYVDADEDPGCDANAHRAKIITQSGKKALKLETDCTSIWIFSPDISVPVRSDVTVTFSGQAEVLDPPGRFSRRLVALNILDTPRHLNPPSSVVYAFYHDQSPRSLPYYREYSLSGLSGARPVIRNVLEDFSQVQNFMPEDAMIDQIAFVLDPRGSATFGDITFSREGTFIYFWINAFIPRDIEGYTMPAPSPFSGKTMIPFPRPVNRYCALTDQRAFSSTLDASHRIQSGAVINISNPNEVSIDSYHDSDPTIELVCNTGEETCYKEASTDNMVWGDLFRDGNKIKVELTSDARNECFLKIGSPVSINYEGTLSIDILERTVEFLGKVGDFPAFEAYVSINDGQPKQLFKFHDEAKKVTDLVFGARNPVNGKISFE